MDTLISRLYTRTLNIPGTEAKALSWAGREWHGTAIPARGRIVKENVATDGGGRGAWIGSCHQPENAHNRHGAGWDSFVSTTEPSGLNFMGGEEAK
jgi:hypothetical protein